MPDKECRIFLCAGEASGDIHGANLVRSLRSLDDSVVCEGLGGRRMASAGMELRFDLAGKAVMGFSEVVRSFPLIRRVFLDTVAYLEQSRPACLVVIDYPGFNLRLAARAAELGIPVVYYISPQVWAWKKQRIHTIAKVSKKVLVILPFEEALYREVGADCVYVGHPLFDQMDFAPPEGRLRGGLVIGVLPGSREQEIRRLLEPMIEVAQGIREVYPEARFITPCVDESRAQLVRDLSAGFPLEVILGQTYELLDAARFCMVTSGTATLETALFGVPLVIMYKTSAFNYWLARRLVKIEHIGLANILAGRGIVPEFIQDDASAERIVPVALDLLGNTEARERMVSDLAALRSDLGGPGASARAAAEVLSVVGRG